MPAATARPAAAISAGTAAPFQATVAVAANGAGKFVIGRDPQVD